MRSQIGSPTAEGRRLLPTRAERRTRPSYFGIGRSDFMSVPRHILQQLGDYVVRRFAFSVGLECAYQPMAQYQRRKRGDVITGDIEPALAGCPRAPCQDQVLAGPWARAPANPALHVVR